MPCSSWVEGEGLDEVAKCWFERIETTVGPYSIVYFGT